MKFIFYLILFLITFVSCIEASSDTVNTNLIYEKGGKKIELVLDNNSEFLVNNIPTKAKFILKNIDPNKLLVSGSGIQVHRKDKNEFNYTIRTLSNTLIRGNLEIDIAEKITDSTYFRHKFIIPVKTKAKSL